MKIELEIEAREALSEEDKHHLGALYCAIWGEGCCDPTTESVGKFAEELLPHIQALNDSLKFKK